MISIIFLVSCNSVESTFTKIEKKEEAIKKEIRLAKTVPNVYVKSTDTDKRFSSHQDTLFFENKLFSGYRYTLNNEHQGDTLILQSYFNGVEEGYQKKWYAKNKLEEVRFYINGGKEGLHIGWWPNGKKRFEFTAYNNEFEGEFREWSEAGILIKYFHYEQGKEKGSQRMWWSDGSVRANYVIRNGKKYGLLGYKICSNPYDSIKIK